MTKAAFGVDAAARPRNGSPVTRPGSPATRQRTAVAVLPRPRLGRTCGLRRQGSLRPGCGHSRGQPRPWVVRNDAPALMRHPRWQAIATQRCGFTCGLTVRVLRNAPARLVRAHPQKRASLCGGPTPSQTLSLARNPLPTNVRRPPGTTTFGRSVSRGFALLATRTSLRTTAGAFTACATDAASRPIASSARERRLSEAKVTAARSRLEVAMTSVLSPVPSRLSTEPPN